MAKRFRGRTEDADAVFLDAKCWTPGAKIAGKVIPVKLLPLNNVIEDFSVVISSVGTTGDTQ